MDIMTAMIARTRLAENPRIYYLQEIRSYYAKDV
jgi:hypothetical protein